MLKIMFGQLGLDAKRVTKPSSYFDLVYDKSWLTSSLAQDIIRGVDLSEYVEDECIRSPLYGMIPPRMLSSGCKSLLILLNEDDTIISGARMGDNCCKWLLEIGNIKDITITLNHYMEFPEPFHIYSINSDKIIDNGLDLLLEVHNGKAGIL